MNWGQARLWLCHALVLGLVAASDVPGQRGRGPDAQFPADREVFQWLLRNHHLIAREIKEIPRGVETRTESDDPEAAEYIRQHVTAMVRRVETGHGIHYRDPLFAALFQHAEQIEVQVEPTKKGVIVREFGTSPTAVQLIRAHAKVVSLFVDRGFDEVHRRHAVPGSRVEDTLAAGEDLSSSEIEVFLAFDRAYIPALAWTKQGQPLASQKALRRLREHWSSSQPRLEAAWGDAEAWHTVAAVVSRSLEEAERHLEHEQLTSAHESLEPIRDVMATARRTVGIDYPLDLLTDFHSTMESIVRPAADMSAADIGDDYFAQLPATLSRASLQWRRVESTDFGPVLAGNDGYQISAWATRTQTVRTAVEELREKLAADDPVAILRAARELKPPFAQLYMSLGDFPDRSGQGHGPDKPARAR